MQSNNFKKRRLKVIFQDAIDKVQKDALTEVETRFKGQRFKVPTVYASMYSAVQYKWSAVQCSHVHYSAVQCVNVVQFSAIQCGALQRCAVQ